MTTGFAGVYARLVSQTQETRANDTSEDDYVSSEEESDNDYTSCFPFRPPT